jgi:acetylornithine deacetylase/succinyl-diaminopimelate desuccinylase-like protein
MAEGNGATRAPVGGGSWSWTFSRMTTAEEFTGPSVELLQALIRNECVNDGTPDSGNETRNFDPLVGYLEGTGVDIQTYTPRPGRDSMMARIAGSDPNAPTTASNSPSARTDLQCQSYSC